ncbi:hypothetical protein [Prosthecomicrobium sp. N25]|uniref:hypothetical protein n=1 Tax=Prosthecomicrobium sp. N25 TaxID=3129254 RepID=UPI003077B22D
MSVKEAGSNFADVIADVRKEGPIQIVDGSEVVATIMPPAKISSPEGRRQALLDLIEEMRQQPPLGLGKFDRAKLHDERLL